MKNLLLFLILIIGVSANAQVAINTDNSAPDPSAMLDVKSTSRGLLAPRMTLGQRNAIVSPATGLVVFQTNSSPGLYINTGTPAVPSWNLVGSNAGQWLNNGSDIYYNLGKVGIGRSNPVARLHVKHNSPEYTAMFGTDMSGPFGWQYGANVTIGDSVYNPILYVGQNPDYKGYLIWNVDPDPTLAKFLIGTYNGSNPLVIQPVGGRVGIGEWNPTGLLHVGANYGGYSGIFGDDISSFGPNGTFTSVGNYSNDAFMHIGQDSYSKGFLGWIYNPDPYQSRFTIGSFSGATPLVLQEAGGNVGIGTTTPFSKLQVQYDADGAVYSGYNQRIPSYIYHAEQEYNGDGQTGLSSYRTRYVQNDGTSYAYSGVNSAIMGYSFWGDAYSFATSGFNWNDYPRSGGVIGAQEAGDYWGSLGYYDSGGIPYGGYFTSSWGGAGKSSGAKVGIGLGAWGELFGANIHGSVYGTYTEGENYAMFANGDVYRNGLDVHLQENGSNTNTVLYTSVSTDVTVQTSGYATLSDGKANISFDAAFSEAVSKNSPVVVAVTPIGNSNGVYLAEVSASGFKVAENNDGKSAVTVSYIAIGKRAGYEQPSLSQEVVESSYTQKLSRGLHNDGDTGTNGAGLYYENGQLIEGRHSSTYPDPNKPAEETVLPKPGKAVQPVRSGSENLDPSTGKVLTSSPANVNPAGSSAKPADTRKVVDDPSKPSPMRSRQPAQGGSDGSNK